MKEKIVIKRFSVLEDIEIDINKINILIGEQATGKSLIAKLVYFFKSEIIGSMMSSIFNSYQKETLREEIRNQFYYLFPEYLLREKGFEITYQYGENKVTFSNQPDKAARSMKINFPRRFWDELRKQNEYYCEQIKSIRVPDPSRLNFIRNGIYDYIDKLFLGEVVTAQFVPSGRSFFHIIERNVGLLMTQQGGFTDYFVGRFGYFLNEIKNKQSNAKDWIESAIYNESVAILGGDYIFDGQDDWIITKTAQKIKLKNSSSGQQEVLPLLLALQKISTFLYKNHVFIEEPEAHLFPGTQFKVVELIALVYNQLKQESGFFITTHSPYILTAFNNLIQAHNTEMDIRHSQKDDKIKENKLNDLKKIVISEKRIPFEDVSIYMIGKGECRDIRNLENKLIDVNIIDEVSNQTASVFDELMNLSYGD